MYLSGSFTDEKAKVQSSAVVCSTSLGQEVAKESLLEWAVYIIN